LSRRTLIAAAILAAALVTGCSRQSTHHLGEWNAQRFNVGASPIGGGIIHFTEDRKVKAHWGASAGPVDWEGDYAIDYAKDPIRLEIRWKSEPPVNIHGSVRFIGKDKKKMQYLFALAAEPLPTDFNHPKSFYWLKKREK